MFCRVTKTVNSNLDNKVHDSNNKVPGVKIAIALNQVNSSFDFIQELRAACLTLTLKFVTWEGFGTEIIDLTLFESSIYKVLE